MVPGSVMKEITKEADGTMTVHLENGKVTITESFDVPDLSPSFHNKC